MVFLAAWLLPESPRVSFTPLTRLGVMMLICCVCSGYTPTESKSKRNLFSRSGTEMATLIANGSSCKCGNTKHISNLTVPTSDGGITERSSGTEPLSTVSPAIVSSPFLDNGLEMVGVYCSLIVVQAMLTERPGVVSYFLSGVLDTAGVTNTTTQNNLFVAMNAVQCVVSFTGSMLVDKLGRRPLLIWVNVGCSICWIGVTAASGIQASKGDKASSAAMVAMIYIFQAIYSFGWTPLQALYPVEVLSFEMRAKGMAFSNMFVTAGESFK